MADVVAMFVLKKKSILNVFLLMKCLDSLMGSISSDVTRHFNSKFRQL